MGKNRSIALGEHIEGFVKSRIVEGRYKNASEVIRAGLRLLEDDEQKIYVLKDAIQAGLDSGVAVNFDPPEHLKALKRKKSSNAYISIHQQAVEDLSNIWNYMLEKWSERQADKYYSDILSKCKNLAAITDCIP